MDDYFSDYKVYSDNDIVVINETGIGFSDNFMMLYENCQKCFALKNNIAITSCVGERDIMDCSFMFYYTEQPIMVKFLKKTFISEFFKKSVNQRFHEFEEEIRKYGYSTRDLS